MIRVRAIDRTECGKAAIDARRRLIAALAVCTACLPSVLSETCVAAADEVPRIQALPSTRPAAEDFSPSEESSATRPATQPAPPPPGPFSLDAATMSGDWFGLGPAMRDAGIEALFFWNSQFMANMAGGNSTGGPKHSATYDAIVTFDLGKMGLIPDADVLVHARQQWGRSVNPWIGPRTTGPRTHSSASQVNDDADYSYGIYVDQLWYRQHFLDRKLALQFGYLDFQTIVDKNAYANSEDKQFMNAALDNNPLFPTASAAGLGAALYLKPCDWYELIVGGADAERLPLYKPGFSTTFHEHAYFLSWIENNFKVRIPSKNGPLVGNYRFGATYDPLPREVFQDPDRPVEREGDSWGFYMSHDQKVYRENDRDNQGLGVFFRYAYQPRDRYRYNQFWSLGTEYTGLVPSRNGDALGFGFAQLRDSPAYQRWRNPASGNETIYELYYAIKVAPWLVVSPDIQYIDNPGGDDVISHAIAGGVRIRVTF